MHDEGVEAVLHVLQLFNLSIADFLVSLLTSPRFDGAPALVTFFAQQRQVLDCLSSHPQASETIELWNEECYRHIYSLEIVKLTAKSSGLMCNSKTVKPADLEGFKLETLAQTMQVVSPRLWKLLGWLLAANSALETRREERWLAQEGDLNAVDADVEMRDADEDVEGWNEEEVDVDLHEDGILADAEDVRGCDARARRAVLLQIRKVIIISVLARSTNRLCTALPVVIGFFAHACNAPARMVNMLSNAGICASGSSICSIVTTLSREMNAIYKNLSATKLSAYAYDNLDIMLKKSVPTLENGGSVLVHITTGLQMRLDHGVVHGDLRFSHYLWDHSPFNLHRQLPLRDYGGHRNAFTALLALHNETRSETNLTFRQDFQAWQFRKDLVRHGPVYFSKFADLLGMPATGQQVPVVKTHYVPGRAMDVNESTNKGNIDAVEQLLKQGGIGPKDGQIAIDEEVILMHGDLATGEKLRSIQESRGREDTPWRRFQFVIFIMGLFHLKMACVDAIWRILVQPKAARLENEGLMSHVAKLRPQETGKVQSNPGFRRMHEVIQHDGIAVRLECWRATVESENAAHKSLDLFAESGPAWNDIVRLSEKIVLTHVARASCIPSARRKPDTERDQQFENSQLKNMYYLLYEEITHAMNVGDVGRVQSCFPAWIFIFKATGKTKYSTFMTRFMLDLHYLYPKRLRHAILMNWLCNPMGKAGRFRGVDWLVERMNLFIKAWHGGSFSNRSVAHILKESQLVDCYQTMLKTVEQNFCLTNQTIAHSAPDLRATLNILGEHIRGYAPHTFTAGRKSKYVIPDFLHSGAALAKAELDTDLIAPVVGGEIEGPALDMSSEDLDVVDL